MSMNNHSHIAYSLFSTMERGGANCPTPPAPNMVARGQNARFMPSAAPMRLAREVTGTSEMNGMS